MKVVFIRPHSNVPSAPVPIGILSLIGYAREHNGLKDYTIIDARSLLLNTDSIKSRIKNEDPDLIGITSFSIERRKCHEVATAVKSVFPEVPVVVGGPYTTGEWRDAVEYPAIDYAVIGEGELTFSRFLKSLEAGEKKPEIKGLAYKLNGKTQFFGFPDLIEDLDEIPMLAWDAVDVEFYFTNKKKRASMNPHPKSRRSVPITTSRGCPYKCAYCHHIFGKQIRKRSVEHVISELKYLKENHNIKEIDIIDDIFNLDHERAKKICDRIIEEKLNIGIAFPNGLRVDQMDEELIDKLVEAGAYRFVYAIESASPRIQKEVGKRLNLEKAKHYIDYTAKKNVSVGGFYMFGFLHETEEEMMMTAKFAIESKMVTANFFILQPFPDTEIFNQAIEAGFQFPEASQEHYYNVTYNISDVSTERIHELRDWVVRKFYFSPWRIYRYFRTTPFKHSFWIKFKMMFLYFLGFNPEGAKGPKL